MALPLLEELVKEELRFKKFTFVGDDRVLVSGSLKTGFAVNINEFLEGAETPTPPLGDCECPGDFGPNWKPFFNSLDGKWYSTRIFNGCTFATTYSNEVDASTRFKRNLNNDTPCGVLTGFVECVFQVNTETCVREAVSCSGQIVNFFNQCVEGCEDNDPDGDCSIYCSAGPGDSPGIVNTTVLSDPCILSETFSFSTDYTNTVLNRIRAK